MAPAEFLQLAFFGLTVAAVPLAVVWLGKGDKSASARYRKLLAITLFFTLDLIMFGAFTRLTDSGLGCPDWPGCYGTSSPLDAMAQIKAAQEAMPSGPVTVSKAWIEMLHRYFAKGLGILFIAIMAFAWIKRRDFRQSPALATVLFFGVCLQGAFGAFTVTYKLMPLIVTIHLLGGNLLLALTAWLYVRQQKIPAMQNASHALLPLAWAGVLLLFVQIALGGWVSTNYAALACMDFPQCQNEWLPPMDFAHGFTLWRDLGQTADGRGLPFAALTAVHWVHRNFAFVIFAVLGWLALQARRDAALRTLAHGILFVLVWQLATGLTNIFFHWPLPVALAHNGGAAVLVLLSALLLARLSLARLPTMQALPQAA
jgi:heme a synthase